MTSPLALALALSSSANVVPITTVPFRVFDDHVYVSAYINEKGPFLTNIDTGGSMGVSSDLAKHLGLSVVERFMGGGVGAGEVEYGRSAPCKIKIGNVEIAQVDNMIEPASSDVHLTAGIGSELFTRFTVQYEYDHHRMSLFKKGDLPSTTGYSKIPMGIYNGMPFVTLEVAGAKGKFTLDTGGGMSTIIQRDFWIANGFKDRLAFGERQKIGVGIGGDVFGYVASIPEFKFGSSTLLDVRGTFSDMEKGSLSDPKRNGTVGQRLLRQFNQIYDYSGGYVYLRPNKSFIKKTKWDVLGCYVAQSGLDIFIGTVSSGSEAERLGLKRNDQVLTVDGRLVTDLREVSRYRSGQRVEVLREGEVISITLP